jgi:hypothetical protein
LNPIFHAPCYIKHILLSILELHLGSTEKYLVVHEDNTRLHVVWKSQMFCEANSLGMTLHPLYTANLARSDFSFRLSEALLERNSLQFGREALFRNSRSLEENLISHIVARILYARNRHRAKWQKSEKT